MYLAIVLGFYSRRIIRRATSDRLKQGLTRTTLKRAVAIRRPPRGVAHHSDLGNKYFSKKNQKLLKANGLILPMDAKGNCHDNAMVETIFKTIKSEVIWRTIFQTHQQAQIAIGHYIEAFYNSKHSHSALGHKSLA